MFRCNFLFQRYSVAFAIAALFLFCSAPLARAQQFQPDSPSEDKRADGTVSVRDLSIPPKAYENFQRGVEELRKRDPARSVNFFNKAIEKYPNYYEAYYHLGVAQKRLGQDDNATASFQKAINLSGGKYALAHYGYALMLCTQGKIKDAERTVRYALGLEQNRSLGETVLGTVLLYEHRTDEAEKTARDALAIEPNTPDAYLVLAGVHGEKGDYTSEIQDLDQFLMLEPESPRSSQVRDIRQAAVGLASQTANKP